MGKTFALAAISALLLASCTLDIPADATDGDPAGLWKARLEREVPPGSSPEAVESYLQTNGALEISLSEDRRTLRAAQPRKIKRVFPPIDTNSIQFSCSFHPESGLESCSVFQSSRSCCGQ